MTSPALTPDDLRHAALVDELAAAIDDVLGEHAWSVHAGVLATLLGRFLHVTTPPEMHRGVVQAHLELVQGVVELLELEAGDRQAH